MTRQNDDQAHVKSLQHCRLGRAHFCRLGSRDMATTLGNWLGDRPFRRLFRFHIDVLPRLARAVPGWGSSYGLRGAAGGLASFYAGSLVLLPGGRVQRSRGTGGGCDCWAFSQCMEADPIKTRENKSLAGRLCRRNCDRDLAYNFCLMAGCCF
jgi:hypothetical protein